MCGRFYIENDIEEIIAKYKVVKVKNITPCKGEIFPGTNIPVILKDRDITLDFFRWGFKVRLLNKEVINARIETVSEKPTFKKAFLKNRCIIPANAFFEWETTEKSKVKYKIELKEKKLFSMAGIYDSFIDKNNIPYFGAVILTKPANEEMMKLHHRMPVFITEDEEDRWLSYSGGNILDVLEELEESNWAALNITPAEGNRQMSIYDLL